jgi:hypothetical protein
MTRDEALELAHLIAREEIDAIEPEREISEGINVLEIRAKDTVEPLLSVSLRKATQRNTWAVLLENHVNGDSFLFTHYDECFEL